MAKSRFKPHQITIRAVAWMQVAISLCVLASLFTPFGATYLWLHIQKSLLKKELKAQLIAGIDKSELAHFTFSASQIETELRWEHKKEFEYKGEMYDVIETQICYDSIRYVCWHDKAETKLNRQLQTLIAQRTGNTPEHQARERLCYHLLKSLAIEYASKVYLVAPETKRHFCSICLPYDSFKAQISKKPPRQVSSALNPTI